MINDINNENNNIAVNMITAEMIYAQNIKCLGINVALIKLILI